MHTYIHKRTHAHMHRCEDICNTYVSMYIYIYIYIYMHRCEHVQGRFGHSVVYVAGRVYILGGCSSVGGRTDTVLKVQINRGTHDFMYNFALFRCI